MNYMFDSTFTSYRQQFKVSVQWSLAQPTQLLRLCIAQNIVLLYTKHLRIQHCVS